MTYRHTLMSSAIVSLDDFSHNHLPRGQILNFTLVVIVQLSLLLLLFCSTLFHKLNKAVRH